MLFELSLFLLTKESCLILKPSNLWIAYLRESKGSWTFQLAKHPENIF